MEFRKRRAIERTEEPAVEKLESFEGVTEESRFASVDEAKRA